MQFSKFGEKFTAETGILELMDDLGKATAGGEKKIMLGGGNPAHIPELQKLYRERMHEVLSNENEFERLISNYDTPQGNIGFVNDFAEFLRNEFGWDVSPENIAVSNGSQTGFFSLFNILAGEFSDGTKKKILLPLAPEYIGYADQGLSSDFFISFKPEIEYIDKHTFKYHIDFESIERYLEGIPSLEKSPSIPLSQGGDNDIGAICVSRPTNPTGNVVTDEELDHLNKLAEKYNVPLIIDNAYGKPFPNAIFVESNLIWNENIILSMSLSKFGLPTSRNGIIVARKEIIDALSKVNAIVSLASGSFGQALVRPWLKDSKITKISNEVIKPFYQVKSKEASEIISKNFDDSLPYFVHKNEGSFFFWMWFKDFPITSKELYNRLKKRNVIVVPGEYFFPGITDKSWKHQYECIRINYGNASREDVEMGLKIIAEEVRESYKL